jgi:ATP-dependent Clp protease ATP-binding subunit ClpA
MISKELENAIINAYKYAKQEKHVYLSTEHLLYAICEEETGARIIKACGGRLEDLNERLKKYFTSMEKAKDGEKEPVQTAAFQRTLHRAFVHAQSAEKKEVEIGDVIISLFEENESNALYFIKKQGIDRLDVLKFVSHGILKAGAEKEFGETEEEMTRMEGGEEEGEEAFRPANQAQPKQGRDFLALYTEDWTQMAKEGKFDALIGRETEIERTIEILCRRIKNNPVHVGDPGVGDRKSVV